MPKDFPSNENVIQDNQKNYRTYSNSSFYIHWNLDTIPQIDIKHPWVKIFIIGNYFTACFKI